VAHGTPRRADHVILATAARAGAPLVEGFDEPLARALAAIPLSGLAVVALGYRTADVHRPRDGYGYLVPRAEGLATLGVLWESSMFPGRAPEGHLLVRVFLGGARRPDVVSWDDTRLVDTAREELGSVTGITAAPVLTRTYRIPDAIAQYTLGHLDRRAAIAAHVSRHAGLHVCGTSYDGVSLNHAVSSGHRTARAVVAAIAETADVPTAAAARA
jgi:oxygen-dependent protoporphyrinogen oxidase